MPFEVDLTGKTKDTVDAFDVPPGWYLARPVNVSQHRTRRDCWGVTFRIDGPDYCGGIHYAAVGNPSAMAQGGGRDFWLNMLPRWLERLGLIPEGGYGQRVKGEWESCYGKQVVLHLKPNTFTSEKSGQQIETAEVDGAPFPVNHKGIPAAVRVYLGLPLLEGQKQPTPAEVERVGLREPIKAPKADKANAGKTSHAAPPQEFV